MSDKFPRAVRFAVPPSGERPMEFSIRTEQCTCGGWITAGGSSTNVALHIRAHNDTIRHRAWRERNEVSHVSDESNA